jgi:3-hydroxy-9,10-secoandrosta-1,3,5(10)-triene-9,17-dione monooxygenase reductase component
MPDNAEHQRLRQAMGAFTTGVTIITARGADGTDVGMTANSFSSVSLTPPMVSWSLGRSSTNIDAFLQAQHFAVHVLASDQDALAARFAQRGVDRFAGLPVSRGHAGLPLIDGAAARFECRTAFQYEGGDHVIFVGEVLAYDHWEREPLVFKRGRFALAVGHAPLPAAAHDRVPGAFEPDFLFYLLGRAYHILYARIRPELARRQLEDSDYVALSFLGVRDGLTAGELDGMVAYTGVRCTPELLQKLERLGLVRVDDSRLYLSDEGRKTVVELLAVSEAACADGEKSLDASESHALRQLLRRMIEATDPGFPHPWQP